MNTIEYTTCLFPTEVSLQSASFPFSFPFCLSRKQRSLTIQQSQLREEKLTALNLWFWLHSGYDLRHLFLLNPKQGTVLVPERNDLYSRLYAMKATCKNNPVGRQAYWGRTPNKTELQLCFSNGDKSSSCTGVRLAKKYVGFRQWKETLTKLGGNNLQPAPECSKTEPCCCRSWKLWDTRMLHCECAIARVS